MDNSRLLAELDRRTRQRRLQNSYGKIYDHARPFGPDNVGVYAWQREFHNAGKENTERMLMAANQVGKTRTAGAETAIHATGLYPPWWEGRRFDHPVDWWCGSVTNEASKDIIQEVLLGTKNADLNDPNFGTGWIPRSRILKITTRQAGISDVVDTILVKHEKGQSEITLKTYEQGRAKWQGTRRHGIWLDEEPPMDIYTEGLTRTIAAHGIVMLTATPLLGQSDVVQHFQEAKPGQGIYVKNAAWEDAPHLDPVERSRLLSSYPEHERDTRTKGMPMMGSGAVFPISDEQLTVDPFEIPKWWRRINGLDFGIDHPAAGAFCALDPEGAGTFYVYDCYKKAGETAVYHAAAMKKHGLWIPNAWPHDGLDRDKGSGEVLKEQYRKHGLRMTKERAAYDDERGNHVEPGIIEMFEWMRTHRFKVFKNLPLWFEEKRMYHRKDGQIVKIRDDIISATRAAFIMRRFARTEPVAAIGRNSPVGPILGRSRWMRNS